MNLIIDIGNSRAKLAVYQDNHILDTLVCDKKKLVSSCRKIYSDHPMIRHGIVANVASPQDETKDVLRGLKGRRITLSPQTPLPFRITYKSPKTLGLDRIALAAAATQQFPQKNVLVIDAGTCITYDIIKADKTYIGGAISPGLHMRYRALNNFTANLPLLEADNLPPNNPVGRTTVECVRAGVARGTTYEIDGFIDDLRQHYGDLTIILTGGDCKILSKSIKNSIFAIKNFLLNGLNGILEYNKH